MARAKQSNRSRKERIVEMVEQLAPRWREAAMKLHAFAEPPGRERRSSRLLGTLLTASGFRVRRGVAGWPTAFVARRDVVGRAPVVGFMAEFDARPGTGHSCGHNLSGPASCLAAHALAEAERGTPMHLRVFGSPAEESEDLGGKIGLLEAGLLKDVDASMMAHAGFMNLPNRDMMGRKLVTVEFRARSDPPPKKPPFENATEAVVMVFSAMAAMRARLRPRTRIEGVITEGGSIVRNCVDVARARAEIFIRSTEFTYVEELERQLRRHAEAAAEVTGTRLAWSSEWGRYLPMRRVPALEAAYERNLRFLGEEVGCFPLEEAIGQTDQGTVSQQLPAIHPYFKMTPRGVEHHTHEYATWTKSESGLAGMLSAARAMALTAFDLTTDPRLMGRIKADFRRAK